MDGKLALIKTISLLVCESHFMSKDDLSLDIVDKILLTIRLPNQVTEVTSGIDILDNLTHTLKYFKDNVAMSPFEYSSVAQSIISASGADTTLYEAFEKIERYLTVDELKKELPIITSSLRSELKYYLRNLELRDKVYKAYKNIFFNKNPNYRLEAENLLEYLNNYLSDQQGSVEKFVIDSAGSDSIEDMEQILTNLKESMGSGGSLITGWQEINDMLGMDLGLRAGIFALVGGLTHKYKSGFCHDLFKHFCIYNKPLNPPEGKKPLHLYISTENRAEEDIARWYISLKENETNEPVDHANINPREAVQYINKRMTENGYHWKYMRINPSDFTYRDLIALVRKLENDNYLVRSIVFDYLALINKAGCNHGVAGEDIRDLIQKTNVFATSKNITFVTPHQLSQEAMAVLRGGVDNFLGYIKGKNYWHGSKSIVNEVGLELYVNIVDVNVDGEKKFYLHVVRGKHRVLKTTDSKHLEVYLPFSKVGYVRDNINGARTGIRDIRAPKGESNIDIDGL